MKDELKREGTRKCTLFPPIPHYYDPIPHYYDPIPHYYNPSLLLLLFRVDKLPDLPSHLGDDLARLVGLL